MLHVYLAFLYSPWTLFLLLILWLLGFSEQSQQIQTSDTGGHIACLDYILLITVCLFKAITNNSQVETPEQPGRVMCSSLNIPQPSARVDIEDGHRCDICGEGHNSTSSLGNMQNYNEMLLNCLYPNILPSYMQTKQN